MAEQKRGLRFSGSTVKSWFQYRCDRKTRYETLFTGRARRYTRSPETATQCMGAVRCWSFRTESAKASAVGSLLSARTCGFVAKKRG